MRLVVPKYWMKQTLQMAGVYNILWGASVILFPSYFFQFFNLALPNYPILWQAIGMMVGVYGIGFIAAANKPFIHWPIVLVGFLGKVFGTIGFAYYAAQGLVPTAFASIIITNDVLWLIPFGVILYYAFEYAQSNRELSAYDLRVKRLKSLKTIVTNTGENLQDLSDQQPVLLVFLRHFGCTFCREALAEIAKQRDEIADNGTRIVLVHMVDEDTAHQNLNKYDLSDVQHISNPDRSLYTAFGLCKGSLNQLFGLTVILRSFSAGIIKGHSIGGFVGNALQMPGVFLIDKGMIVQSFTHHSAADRPDYIELSRKSCDMDFE